MSERSLNAVYSRRSMRRRYEVWFLRFLLADGSGAWWFRYLLLNLGRPGGGGCPGNPCGQPVEVWATWFPRDGKPQSVIQGFAPEQLSLSEPGARPFRFQIGDNRIGEDACAGLVDADGHRVSWDLRYRSTLGVTMSNVGWIGFSRTPHSDAVFSGEITFDGRTVRGQPLGYGLQGHNCGFRHRHRWSWAHCLFHPSDGSASSTLEALEYEMPLGLRFRKALLWHGGKLYTFKSMEEVSRERENLQWAFRCANREATLSAVIDGRGPSLHRLPYLKTDCSSSFEVVNNSLARAAIDLARPRHSPEQLTTAGGAVIEMVGE